MIADRPLSAFAISTRAGLPELMAMEDGKSARQAVEIWPTGLPSLDLLLGGGIRSGEVSVWAARSGHGKSALIEQIALHVSEVARVTLFTLELGREKTTDRLAAKMMDTDEKSAHNAICAGSESAMKAVRALTQGRTLRLESASMFDKTTCETVRTAANNNESQVVIIDDLRSLDGWMDPNGKTFASAVEIVKYLVSWAQTSRVHIMAVHQLTRYLQGKKPTQYDLADAYFLAQKASVVTLINRPYRGTGMRDVVAELIVDKNRSGPEGIVHQHWAGRRMVYEEMTCEELDNYDCCKRSAT